MKAVVLSVVSLSTALTLGGTSAARAQTSPASEPPAQAVPSSSPADPSADPAVATAAAFRFAVAKMLAEGGSLAEAREAFREAQALAPDDPYVLIEHAELLQRMAARARLDAAQRSTLLDEALDLAARSVALEPKNVDLLRSLAQVHLATSDTREGAVQSAAKALEQIRGVAPWDLQAMIPLGQIYLQSGDADRATDLFSELAGYAPDTLYVFQMLAESARQASRSEEAERALERILVLDPTELDSRVSLARLYSRRGEFARAAQILSEVPDEYSGDPQVQAELAWQLHRSGDHEGALRAAETVLERDPEDRWIRLVQALALGELGRFEESLASLDTLRAEDPDNLELVRATARVLESAERGGEAAQLYLDVIARSSGDAARRPMADRARLLLAGVYARAGEGEAALEALQPLIESPERDLALDATLAFADLLHESGRTDEALEILRSGSAPRLGAKEVELLLAAGRLQAARRASAKLAESASPDVLMAAAQAAQRWEAFDLSIPLLEQALDGRPDDVNMLFLLGAGHERSGEHDQAVAAFRRLLEQRPDFHPALNYLGYMWAERGENLAEALALVQRAVDLEPDNGAYLDSLGWAHFRRGELEEARGYLERAHELLPSDPTILEHLADLFAAVGERSRARDLYRQALDLRQQVEPGVGEDADTVAELQRKLDELR